MPREDQLNDELFEKTGVSSITQPSKTEVLCPHCKNGKLSYVGRYLGRSPPGAGWGSSARSIWVYKFVCFNDGCGVEFNHKERR